MVRYAYFITKKFIEQQIVTKISSIKTGNLFGTENCSRQNIEISGKKFTVTELGTVKQKINISK